MVPLERLLLSRTEKLYFVLLIESLVNPKLPLEKYFLSNELPRSKLRGIKSLYKEYAFRSKLRELTPNKIKYDLTSASTVIGYVL